MDSLDDVVSRLKVLRADAGSPSFSDIAQAVYKVRRRSGLSEFEARPARTTIYGVFQTGRRRLDAQLVGEIAVALGGSAEEAQELTRTVGRLQQGDRRAQVAVAGIGIPYFAGLVGRASELGTLAALPEGAVASVCGLGGMGKSHLAFAAAEAALERGEADSVIHVDLRGNNAELPPVTSTAAREALLRALGQASAPRDQATSKRLLADALADRRTVIVLDDAADADQLAGVLPDDLGRARVLVTSRPRIDLPEIAQLVLEPLPEDDAIDLLSAALPAAALSTDPIAARSLVESVGRIPLAIGLLGVRMSESTDWTLADHARRLSERLRQYRLETPVVGAIESSYSPLPASAQEALRQLAVQPLPTLATDSATTLWDVDARTSDTLREELERANLLQLRGGRLSLHDVVRAFAIDKGLEEDPESSRTAAIDRLADHLVGRAWSAHVGLHAAGEGCLYGAREAAVTPLESDQAAAWFEHEGDNVLTLAATLEERCPGIVVELSGALGPWLNNTSRHADSLWLHSRAVALADPKDPIALARVKVALGYALARTGDADAADEQLEGALAIFQETDEVAAHSAVIAALAINDHRAGRLSKAAERFDELVLLAKRANSPYEEATYLGNASATLLAIGQPEEAVVRVYESLRIARRENFALVIVANLINLAEILVPLGQLDAALAAADEAIPAAPAGPVMVGYALVARFKALTALGRQAEADADLERAAEIAASTGDDELLRQLAELAPTEG